MDAAKVMWLMYEVSEALGSQCVEHQSAAVVPLGALHCARGWRRGFAWRGQQQQHQEQAAARLCPRAPAARLSCWRSSMRGLGDLGTSRLPCCPAGPRCGV